MATTSDNRVWTYDVASSRIEVIYDAAVLGASAPLTSPDNVTVARSGDLFVAEDAGNLELVVITPPDAQGARTATSFMRITGPAAVGSRSPGRPLARAVPGCTSALSVA